MKNIKIHSKIPLLIVAGEISGDQLGALILKDLNFERQYYIFGCGGNEMRKQGVETLYDISDMAIIGIFEVIVRYFHILSMIRELIAQAKKKKFNMPF